MMRKFLILVVLLICGQVFGQDELLTNESIIKMVQAGLGKDLILEKIEEATQVQFDFTTDALIALKEAKVDDDLIRAMKAKVSGTTNTPSQATSPVASGSSTEVAQFEDAHLFVKAPEQEKPEALEGVIIFDAGTRAIRFMRNGVNQIEIPYASITGLLYERTAKPRYGWGLLVSWPLLFTKSKSHYFTVQYKNPEDGGEFAIFRFHKKNYQMALATIEAQTGMKVDRTEER